MRRSIRHVNAGLLAWSLAFAGCTSILGINNDYREADGGPGGGGPGGGSPPSAVSSGSSGVCADAATACLAIPAGWSPVWVTAGADPLMTPGQCADGSPQKLY